MRQRRLKAPWRGNSSSIICKVLSGWGLDVEVCVGGAGAAAAVVAWGGGIVRQRWVGY